MANILLIDDDSDYLESFADALSSAGHHVRTALGGERGLATLSGHLPDVIILDLEMPVVSGPEVAWRLCVEDVGKEKIPILFISGSPDLAVTAAKIGTRYFLAKPFDFRAVLALIERILSERSPPSWPEHHAP